MVLDMVPMVFPALHSQTVLYCTILYCTVLYLPSVMVLEVVPTLFPALHSQTAARSLELGLATSSRCTERSGRDTSGRTSTWNIA